MINGTLIITSNVKNVIENIFVDEIKQFIFGKVITYWRITNDNPIEIIILKSLKRLIIVCPRIDISEFIHRNLNIQHIQIKLSLTSTPRNSLFLEPPIAKRIFLVSPPQSPPSEFEFDKYEEIPNKDVGHSYNYESYENDTTHTIVKTPHCEIIIDKCETLDNSNVSIPLPIPTSMPPKSIFF